MAILCTRSNARPGVPLFECAAFLPGSLCEPQSKLLKGGYIGDYYRVIKGDTRSLGQWLMCFLKTI